MKYYRNRVIENINDVPKFKMALDDLVSFLLEEINKLIQKVKR